MSIFSQEQAIFPKQCKIIQKIILWAPGSAGNSSCVMLNSGAESGAGLLTIPTEKKE